MTNSAKGRSSSGERRENGDRRKNKRRAYPRITPESIGERDRRRRERRKES